PHRVRPASLYAQVPPAIRPTSPRSAPSGRAAKRCRIDAHVHLFSLLFEPAFRFCKSRAAARARAILRGRLVPRRMRTVTLRMKAAAAAACMIMSGAAFGQADPSTSPLYVAQGHCESTPPLRDTSSARWNGWGPTVTNTRFQPAEAGGITLDDVPRLRLKWVYGLPREQQARGQPAVIGGRMFVGSQAGAVYALDARTGRTHWQFFPQAGLRSATSVGPHTFPDGREGYAVYFVDAQANVYALDADTGEQIWHTKVEDHPSVRGTGALTLHEGRLYVPMTGINEAMSGANPDYECCTFRGSMTARDARKVGRAS